MPCRPSAAVLRRVDAGDAVGLERADLGGSDHPAAAAEDADVARRALLRQSNM